MTPPRRYALTAVILAVIIFTGFGAGRGAGRVMLSGLISGNASSLLLFFRPASEYIHNSGLLNSSDESERLAGYYSLVDNHLVELSFLRDRLANEQSQVNRRTILWVMTFSKDEKGLLDMYESLYPAASIDEKTEMLRGIFRKNRSLFRSFTERVKADPRLVKQIADTASR